MYSDSLTTPRLYWRLLEWTVQTLRTNPTFRRHNHRTESTSMASLMLLPLKPACTVTTSPFQFQSLLRSCAHFHYWRQNHQRQMTLRKQNKVTPHLPQAALLLPQVCQMCKPPHRQPSAALLNEQHHSWARGIIHSPQLQVAVRLARRRPLYSRSR